MAKPHTLDIQPNDLPSPLREFWDTFSAGRGSVIALGVFAAMVTCALFAGWIAPHDPIEQYRDHMLAPPVWRDGGSIRFLLGTDEAGRDLLSRLIFGARISLFIALMSVLMSLLPGIALGLLAAFYSRWVSPIIMRLMDIMLALPALLLAICIITILGPGLINTMLAIAIGTLPSYTRLARAAALAEINKDYVTASRVAGAVTFRLMFIVVLPN